jgi:Mg2+ and Co2+ transporter CorA
MEEPQDKKTEPVINDASAAVDTATQVDFLVKQMISQIDQMKDQLKEHRQMLKDAFITNVQHKDLADQIKDLTKKKKEMSQAIGNQESVKQTKEEIRTLAEDLKTVEKKLSQYLQQYVETFNSRTIEDANGNLKEIVTLYKLVSRAVPQAK